MILKSITEKKKVTRVMTVKRNETYVEALARLKKLVEKEFDIDGLDCEYLISKGNGGCEYCILGTNSASAGHRCLKGRLMDIIDEAHDKATRRKL